MRYFCGKSNLNMNKFLIMSLSILGVLFFNACDKDKDIDDDADVNYGYHAHIMSPDNTAKKVGDSIYLHVNFESHTSETVHNVNVKIYNEADNSLVIYDEPSEAHVHATEGSYELRADIALTEANGVLGQTTWIVEAKVWPMSDEDDEHNHSDEDEEHNHGDEDGAHTVTETVKFYVQPN